MDHFGRNGYHTRTGKVMHNRDHQEWKEFDIRPTTVPFYLMEKTNTQP